MDCISERLYEKMLLIRGFEEKIAELFSKGYIHGTTHLYVGQEAIAAGVCAALKKEDIIFSTHRGHGHCIAKGIDINKMMAEFFGRESGCSGGKGGSMHIADFDNGNYGSNGVVGGGIPLAVGAALSVKMRRQDKIVVCFFGDGATNQGAFHESLNLASIWRLPVLFVCEANEYGLSMKTRRAMNVKSLDVRAQSYGMPGKTIDGNDACLVYSETEKAKKYVRSDGPMLLVCETYRISGHSKSDNEAYRDAEEINRWRKKDPIVRMEEQMISAMLATKDEMEAVKAGVAEKIDKAVEFSLNCPYPKKESLFCGVYA